jgi:hypothetical protein
MLRAQWDRAGAILAVVVGAIMLIVGWAGASGSGLAAEQIPYVISCGVGGLFVLGIGAVLWLSADLRDEWHKLDSVEDAIRSEHGGTIPDRAPDTDPATGPIPLVPAGDEPVRPAPRKRARATAR